MHNDIRYIDRKLFAKYIHLVWLNIRHRDIVNTAHQIALLQSSATSCWLKSCMQIIKELELMRQNLPNHWQMFGLHVIHRRNSPQFCLQNDSKEWTSLYQCQSQTNAGVINRLSRMWSTNRSEFQYRWITAPSKKHCKIFLSHLLFAEPPNYSDYEKP